MLIVACVFAVSATFIRAQGKGWETLFTKHTEAFCINPLRDSMMYCASTWRLYRSYDAGQTWSLVHAFEGPVGTRQIYVVPQDTNVIIEVINGYIALNGIYRSVDCGVNFQRVLTAFSSNKTIVANSGAIILATMYPAALWRSTNLGKDWDTIRIIPNQIFGGATKMCAFDYHFTEGQEVATIGLSPPIIARCFSGNWSVSYKDSSKQADEVPKVVYASDSIGYAIISRSRFAEEDGFLRTTDGGKHWVSVRSPSSLWALNIDPNDFHHVYVGQFAGLDKRFPISSVYESYDCGNNWEPVGVLHDNMIWDISIDRLHHELYAIGGQGVHRVSIAEGND